MLFVDNHICIYIWYEIDMFCIFSICISVAELNLYYYNKQFIARYSLISKFNINKTLNGFNKYLY